VITRADSNPGLVSQVFEAVDTRSILILNRDLTEGVEEVTGDTDQTKRTGLFL
jgi:hypothetical protein